MTEQNTTDLVPLSVGTMLALREVLETVPTVEDDPTPRMLEAILAAESDADWQEVFEAWHFKDLAGGRYRFNAIRWSPSRFKARTGIFLICDVANIETGEAGVLTVGGEIAVAQLLNCWKRKAYPHDFEIVRKDQPTRKGFYPMRLRPLPKPVQPAAEG